MGLGVSLLGNNLIIVGNKQDSGYRVVGIRFGTKYRLSSDHSLLSSLPGTGPRFLM